MPTASNGSAIAGRQGRLPSDVFAEAEVFAVSPGETLPAKMKIIHSIRKQYIENFDTLDTMYIPRAFASGSYITARI
jgi:hypothetical protein